MRISDWRSDVCSSDLLLRCDSVRVLAALATRNECTVTEMRSGGFFRHVVGVVAAEADGEAVPGVVGGDQQGRIDQFMFAAVGGGLGIVGYGRGRKRGVGGKSVSVSVSLGGGGI